MKKLFTLLLVALISTFICLFFLETSKAQSQEPVALFNFAGAEKSIDKEKVKPRLSMAEVREREISVKLDSINFEMTQKLSLPLLDGKSHLAVRRDREGFVRLGADEFSWRGQITGADGWTGDVILSVKGRALSGLIYSETGVYEIVPQADFKHVLVEIDQSRFAPCGGAIPVPEGESASAANLPGKNAGSAMVSADTVAPDDGTLIDVLVVYTAPVSMALGGVTQTQAFIQQAIASTNTTYQNSGITPRLRLVGTKEVAFEEPAENTLSAALSWVRTDVTVAAEREAVKADLVAMITENGGGACGLAYLQRSVGAGFAGAAFSATARSCAVGNLSFAHELGHNEGCEHNPENGGAPNVASYPYAFGHYVDGVFRTVMSYADPCTSSNCKRIPYFSNPSIKFNNVATGIIDERDNSRVINNTALTVSQFRNSGGGAPAPTPTPLVLPNLTPYQPSGWSDKIVVSTATGTHTDSSTLTTADTFYVDWSLINNGDITSIGAFTAKLYVDGVERRSWPIATALNPGGYVYVQDQTIGQLAAGQHTVKIVVDTSGEIAEKNEADNEYTKVINVAAVPPQNTIQFSQSSYTFTEGTINTGQGFGALTLTIQRGDTTSAATVQYSTSDLSGGNECSQVTGHASQRCDYGTAAGTLRFAAGESTKQVRIPIINDGYAEGNETFTIALQNAVGATLGTNSQVTVTIIDTGVLTLPSGNRYLGNEFFVRMNYLDFLSREPDTEGFGTWAGVLNNCGPEKGFLGAPKACDRAFVSHGFIASPEFTTRGYLAYRMYEVALSRLPRYSEFVPDMAAMSGAPNSQELEQNTQQFADSFTARAEFTAKYGDVSTPAQAALFIARLEQNAGVTLPATTTTLPGQPPQYGRQELINLRLNGTLTLGQTLRAFVEQKVVYDRFFERGFVTMQYFGFLKRDPDLNDPNLLGWTEWVFVFTNGGAARNRPDILPRDIHHLTFGFIYSEEYRKRFGQP